MKKIYLIVSLLLLSVVSLMADGDSKVQLSGAFQTDMLVPQVDTAIGANSYMGPFCSNNYLNLNLNSKYVTAGARLELMHKPLPGYGDNEFAGGGVKGIFVSGGYKYFNITIGDIYDQFGSGVLLRLYEERSLGVDNALRGGRLILTPYKGITFKALGGMQRQFFNFDTANWFGFRYKECGAVMGANLDLDIEEWSPKMMENDYHLRIGGAFVSKYNPDEVIVPNPEYNYRLNLPKFVGAGEVRASFSHGGWQAMAEYAYKANDPTAENEYIYRPGQSLFMSLAYSQKGMSVLVQAKRSENMVFRSDRGKSAYPVGNINNMPAFGYTHTYACASNLPYATQADGEWAFQAELAYKFPAKTPMGGKYGTSFKLHGTYVRGLDNKPVDEVRGSIAGTDGYSTTFFGMGDEYFLDAHLEFEKKITKIFSMKAMYMYQRFNQVAIQKHGHFLQAHTIVTDFKVKASKKCVVRLEGQFQYTTQNAEQYEESHEDYGNNIYGLVEVSFLNDFMVQASDHYYFRSNINYYNVSFTYTHGPHRVSLAYLRSKAGYNCSGGVCRVIPAQKGLTVGYSVSF